MTGSRAGKTDYVDLPAVHDDVGTGAAADSADGDFQLESLPHVLRYAMLITISAGYIRQRLAAEIEELCPRLPLSATFARTSDVGTPHRCTPAGSPGPITPFVAARESRR
jgi:hypothetical protein